MCEVLGLDPSKTKRIVFHEITKPAIKKAVEQPRTVDMNLVDAQQARRILDRIVGFEISPVLWRKVYEGLQDFALKLFFRPSDSLVYKVIECFLYFLRHSTLNI